MQSSSPGDGVTASLARAVADARALPESVTHEVVRAFLNFVGCALGGARDESTGIVEAALNPGTGSPEASIVGWEKTTDVATAALLNCMSASIYSFDDTHAQALAHGACPVAAPLLAAAEAAPIGGPLFILAMCWGIETLFRLSKALSVPPAVAEQGWLQTGITGAAGAAVATSKAMGLDARQIRTALGIALSTASGTRDASGMNFALVTAQASRAGLQAARLAAAGFRANENAIESTYGFAHMFSRQTDLTAITAGLGVNYETSQITYKPFPCGVVIHPIVEACLELARGGALRAGPVEKVIIQANPDVIRLAGLRHPESRLEAQISLFHWAATALLMGEATVESGSKVDAPETIAMRDLITAVPEPSLAKDSAIVEVVAKDGRRIRSHVEHCVGSATRPMSDEQLSDKFLKQAERVLTRANAERVLAMCWSLESASDVGSIPGEIRRMLVAR